MQSKLRNIFKFCKQNAVQGGIRFKINKNSESIKELEPIFFKEDIMNKVQQIQKIQYTKQELKQMNEDNIQLLKKNSNNIILQTVQADLKNFYSYIKDIILQTEFENMNEMSQYYLMKEGKLIRPTINILLTKHLFSKQKQMDKEINNTQNQLQIHQQNEYIMSQQKIWAGVVELLHVSSLIHDDIIDSAELRRGQSSAHKKFGKKNATFSANYIIGRSGRKIAELNNLHIYQIYSQIMDDLTKGELIQAGISKNYQKKLDQIIEEYMNKTYYKTAALISHSCRGVALINQENIEIQKLCFKFGQNLGIAFQLIDDVLDYVSDSKQLGKESLSDLKEGNVTGPILFTIQNLQINNQELYYKLLKILNKKNIVDEDCQEVKNIINLSIGIEKTINLSLLYIFEAIDCLKKISAETDTLQNLTQLALDVIIRQK